MILHYLDATKRIENFAAFKIYWVPHFWRRSNRDSRAYALWAVTEILELVEKERDMQKGVGIFEIRIHVIEIIDNFISKMDRFLGIRYDAGFECARGTASRLKRYLLEEKS